MKFGKNYRTLKTDKKQWPVIFKTEILGKTYFGAQNIEGKVFIRRSELGLKFLTGISKVLMKRFSKL